MNASCVSQLVIHKVSNASDNVFKRKSLIWKNNISLKKDRGYVIAGESLDKSYFKFRAEKCLCSLVSCTKHLFEEHEMLCITTIV